MKMEYSYEDIPLLSAIKNGDEKAFDVLFKKYYPMLCAYGNKFIELEGAEECVQDAMLWLWENKEMLDLCLQVRNTVFTVEKKIPKEIEVDKNDTLNSKCDHFYMEYDGKPTGALRCMRISDDTVKLQRFCILREDRKRGLGREMIASVEEYYRNNSFTRVELDAKYEAFGFYEKCGYRRNSDLFEEAGIPHVKMVKEL